MATPIELDLEHPWSFDDLPRHRRAPVGVALAVAVALVVLLTGPVVSTGGPPAFAWRAEVAGGFFWLTTDSAYTVDQVIPSPGSQRLTFSARDPLTGVPRWSIDLPGPLALSYTRAWEVMVSRFPPSLDQRANTTIIDTRTGEVVRGYPAAAMPLVYLAGDVAVTIDRDPAAGPDPPLPDLSVAVTGLDRPHLVVARDLATGSVRWSRRLPAGTMWSLPGVQTATEGIVALPADQNWLVTSTVAGDYSVWDLVTGRILASGTAGPLGPESYVSALEATVLVRTGSGSAVTMTGYDPGTLQPRWRITPPAIYAAPSECGSLLCLETDRGVWAVDRLTGAFVWRLDGPHLRSSLGPTKMLASAFGEQLVLLDVTSGHRLAADGRWRVVDQSPLGSPVIIAKPNGGSSAELASLDLTAGTTTPLGTISPFSNATQCLVANRLIACEEGGILRVWRQT